MVLSSYWIKHLSCLISSEIPYNYYLCVRIFLLYLQVETIRFKDHPSDTYIFTHKTKPKYSIDEAYWIQFIIFNVILFESTARLFVSTSTHLKCNHILNSFRIFFLFFFPWRKKFISNRFQNKRTRKPYRMSQVVE